MADKEVTRLQKRRELLEQLGKVRNEWAAKYGDVDGDASADAEAAYYRKAQPILDKLAALRK